MICGMSTSLTLPAADESGDHPAEHLDAGKAARVHRAVTGFTAGATPRSPGGELLRVLELGLVLGVQEVVVVRGLPVLVGLALQLLWAPVVTPHRGQLVA